MSRVILHIGTHKTATTTIQDMFALNAPLLARHGVIYPRLGRAPGHHGLVSDWVTALPSVYTYSGGSQGTLRQLAARYGKTDHCVFLSSEEFSRATVGMRPDFNAIRDALAGFDRIEVVCVLREQWQFLQSIYLEVSRRRQPPRPPEFVQSALDTDMVDGLWTDYNLLYDHLLQAFAPDQITFLDFQQSRRSEGGVIGAMLRHLGIPLGPAALELVNDGQSNPSPRPVPSWAANIIAHPHPAPVWLVDAVGGAFDVQYGAGQASCLWTGPELATLLDYGASRNARLVQRHQPHQPGFRLDSAGPPIPKPVDRGDLTAEFWIRTSRWTFATYPR